MIEHGANPPTKSDVLIVGAGVAGRTAAGLLARKGRTVQVLGGAVCGVPSGSRWVSSGVEPLLKALGVPARDAAAEPVRGVAFHASDFSKRQEVSIGGGAGWFVDLADWNSRLTRSTAATAAADASGEAVAFRMREDEVVVGLADGTERAARLLLLADGSPSRAAGAIGMELRPSLSSRWGAQLEWPATRGSRIAPGVLHWVLGIEGGAGLATFWSAGGRESLSVFASSASVVQSWLARLLPGLVDSCGVVLPRDLPAGGAPARCVPAGLALEIESHVGKRALAIGDAGGFVAAATCEGIYPAMWSAQIAAEVADAALTGDCPQDELREFDARWRGAMAEYLRPPNADLQFLLPLVFSNKQMAERLARALLRGETL